MSENGLRKWLVSQGASNVDISEDPTRAFTSGADVIVAFDIRVDLGELVLKLQNHLYYNAAAGVRFRALARCTYTGVVIDRVLPSELVD